MKGRLPEFHAIVRWSSAHGSQREIATGGRLIHPSRFEEDGPSWPPAECWSVVLTFEHPVAYGDQTSEARARFLVADAPQSRLAAGRTFEFFEGPNLLATISLQKQAGIVEADA